MNSGDNAWQSKRSLRKIGQTTNKHFHRKRTSTMSPPFSPTSPGGRSNDINWQAALNRLTPGNIKRTATDLMKEWEKSLSPPVEGAPGENAPVVEDRIL